MDNELLFPVWWKRVGLQREEWVLRFWWRYKPKLQRHRTLRSGLDWRSPAGVALLPLRAGVRGSVISVRSVPGVALHLLLYF